MTDKTREELLLVENEELKNRLREAEENLNAIRSGGVDALVISGPQGEQVFTLNEADRPYRIIIEEMNEGTVTTTIDGIILYSNKQFAKMLEVPLSKLLGSSIYDYVFPEDHEVIKKFLSKDSINTGRSEILLHGQDGGKVWSYVSFSPLEIDQTPVFCWVIADITERKIAEAEKRSLESQVILAQKMESLGRFAGGIAHDLNNVLYPIIIDIEMLLEEIVPNTALHQTLSQILKAANRQKDLIRQILSFSRKSEYKLIPIKVIPVLKETINLLRSTLPSTIKIEKHIDVQADTILGDSTQIQQVIMNLFRNAADALGLQTGTIQVRLENITVRPSAAHPEGKAGQHLSLIVKDTGQGMTPEIMHQIFEPFYTTKEIGKGSGMGLAVVHGIVKNHGGTITVESELGKGSEFTVSFPVTDEKILIQTPSHKVLLKKGKGKVLLVDDEEIILTSIQNALKRLGYDVVAVNDALEAFEQFRRAPEIFDFVITDLTMPKLTGVELAKNLMDIRPDLPVILCTGFNDSIHKNKAESFGIRELLLKPASINELKGAISRALEKFDT